MKPIIGFSVTPISLFPLRGSSPSLLHFLAVKLSEQWDWRRVNDAGRLNGHSF